MGRQKPTPVADLSDWLNPTKIQGIFLYSLVVYMIALFYEKCIAPNFKGYIETGDDRKRKLTQDQKEQHRKEMWKLMQDALKEDDPNYKTIEEREREEEERKAQNKNNQNTDEEEDYDEIADDGNGVEQNNISKKQKKKNKKKKNKQSEKLKID